MPYLDGTGPMGTGPYGRGMGPCRRGRPMTGFGRGYGRRFGSGREVLETGDVDVKRSLESEIESLEQRLSYLRERLKDQGSDSS